MKKSFVRFLISLYIVVFAAAAMAANQAVGQKNKQFTVSNMQIKVGETVDFRNDDPFFHNVFSLSLASTFDLGSYPAGESKSVTFDKPGTVEVMCAIHPTMFMTIEVVK